MQKANLIWKTFRTALSIFLSVALVVCYTPIPSYADSSDSLDDSYMASLAAMAAAKEGDGTEVDATQPNPLANTLGALDAINEDLDAGAQIAQDLAASKQVEVTEGSTTGFDTEDDIEYIFNQDLTFTNDAAGSGITIPECATVIFTIAQGVTITAQGGDANGTAGAGAGVHVPESATLIVRGFGTLVATGGNASPGVAGQAGENAALDANATDTGGGKGLMYGGDGGAGGAGGGGAAAGIGGIGGDGGAGGAGGAYYNDTGNTLNGHVAGPCSPSGSGESGGTVGTNGASGSPGTGCGNVYVLDITQVKAVAGTAADNGANGSTGTSTDSRHTDFNNKFYAGGGGGGGGGTGGLAGTYAIGAGGDGGAGGGGGGSGGTRCTDVRGWTDHHPSGGTGGTGGAAGSGGESSGSVTGGTGGSGGELPSGDKADGNVFLNDGASVDGRSPGYIQTGTFSFDEKGHVVNENVTVVTDPSTFSPTGNTIYLFNQNMEFNASGANGNGITIPENSQVILEIQEGVTVTATGADAPFTASSGAGAGIYVPESSTLFVRGGGTLIATGGKASQIVRVEDQVIGGGGGAGAGIGGSGGSAGQRGSNCGTIYFSGEDLTVDAKGGKGGKDIDGDSTTGRAPDFGIGGGGAGGSGSGVLQSGTNGSVYYDYTFVKVKGRDFYFHRGNVVLSRFLEITLTGYNDLVLGTTDDTSPQLYELYYALREAANRGALVKDAQNGYSVEPMPKEEGYEQNEICNGAYRVGGVEWNKHLIDNSGGYLYLLGVYFGHYIKSSHGHENPYWCVEDYINDVKKYAQDNGLYYSDDMGAIMHEIFFNQHYQEALAGGNDPQYYTKDHPTKGKHKSKGDGLQMVGYTYSTVYDTATARYMTISYDTNRKGEGGAFGWQHLYYNLQWDTFCCTDGYKGVRMENWMSFLPDSMSLAQVNIPGTHDAGTFNVSLNGDAITWCLENVSKIIEAKTGLQIWKQVLIALGGAAVVKIIADLALALLEVADIAAALFLVAKLPSVIPDARDAIARCQDLDISQQLASGIRLFDTRIAFNRSDSFDAKNLNDLSGNEKLMYAASYLKLSHGSLGDMGVAGECKHDLTLVDAKNKDGSWMHLDDVFNACFTFLGKDESKKETVVVFYQNEGSADEKIDNSEYNQLIKAVLDVASQDSRFKVLHDGDPMPSMQEAAGKIILIGQKDYATTENAYSVSAATKIDNLKKCYDQSSFNPETGSRGIPQDISKQYDLSTKDLMPRVIYASTYDLSFHPSKLVSITYKSPFEGTPREIANDVNEYLGTYMYQRGQYYGWVLMNFPTGMATSNIAFSNIFDKGKLSDHSSDTGMTDTPFSAPVLIGAILVLLAAAGAGAVFAWRRKNATAAESAEAVNAAAEETMSATQDTTD
ncbi:MAG: hypothetical protein Q4E12_04395 [Coriobacteriia bacterium]|nr:hypothetical protein [Coriobacteriia bacterium]